MQIEGTFHGGVVVFDGEVPLQEGTRVTVVALPDESSRPTDYELFREIIGKATGLPEDMALNHNHYVRGGPKK